MKQTLMRLDKYLGHNTLFSRNQVTKIIKQGLVEVNGSKCWDGATKINLECDVIQILDDVVPHLGKFYLALNKPAGYVCSHTDYDGESILSLINPEYCKDVHIVGRLDKDTTGLVLLTNDGEFTHFLKSPKSNISKEYVVTLKEPLTKQMINTLKQPMKMDGK